MGDEKKRFKKVYVEITNVCNLQCEFCVKTLRQPMFMEAEQFEKIAIAIKPYTDYVYLHVLGEPLLHHELGDILDICERYQLQVGITTNGTLIRYVENRLLGKPALRQMNFSLHSLSGSQEEKEKTLDAIFRFIDHAAGSVYACLRLWNVSETNEENDSFLINRIMENFTYTNTIDYKTTPGNGFVIAKNVFLQMQKQFTWPTLSKPPFFVKGNCYGLRNHLGILVDGTVTPCCIDYNGDIRLGNIFADDLSDILSSSRAIRLQEGFQNRIVVENLCQTCGVAFNLNK